MCTHLVPVLYFTGVFYWCILLVYFFCESLPVARFQRVHTQFWRYVVPFVQLVEPHDARCSHGPCLCRRFVDAADECSNMRMQLLRRCAEYDGFFLDLVLFVRTGGQGELAPSSGQRVQAVRFGKGNGRF